jgi:hypothetical protein
VYPAKSFSKLDMQTRVTFFDSSLHPLFMTVDLRETSRMAGSLGAEAIVTTPQPAPPKDIMFGEALLVSAEIYFVAETLQNMALQGAMIRPSINTAAASLQTNQYETALRSAEALTRSLKAFVEMSSRVKEYVSANDGMGEFGDELGELALRARSLVISKYLNYLVEQLQQSQNRELTRDWFGSQLSNIAALRSFMSEKLRTIHSKWQEYRPANPQPGMLATEQSTTLRLMIRAGQRQLSDLRYEPDIARFLKKGIEATSLPAIQLACRHIDIAFGVEIDVEPSRAAHRKRIRLGTPPGVPLPREQPGDDRD